MCREGSFIRVEDTIETEWRIPWLLCGEKYRVGDVNDARESQEIIDSKFSVLRDARLSH